MKEYGLQRIWYGKDKMMTKDTNGLVSCNFCISHFNGLGNHA